MCYVISQNVILHKDLAILLQVIHCCLCYGLSPYGIMDHKICSLRPQSDRAQKRAACCSKSPVLSLTLILLWSKLTNLIRLDNRKKNTNSVGCFSAASWSFFNWRLQSFSAKRQGAQVKLAAYKMRTAYRKQMGKDSSLQKLHISTATCSPSFVEFGCSVEIRMHSFCQVYRGLFI